MEQWLYLFLWGSLLGSVVVLAFTIIYNRVLIPKIFDYAVTLKYIVNGRSKVRTDIKARKVKGRDGIYKLKLKGGVFKSLNIPMPPDSTIEVTSAGKNYLCGYVVNDTEVVWTKDDLSKMDWTNKDEEVVQKLDPFTQEQRLVWINEERKAARDKKLNLGEILQIAAPSVMILMIFVLALVFWEDISQPMLDAQENQKLIIEGQAKLFHEMDSFAKTLKGVEVLGDDQDILAPSDEGVTEEEFNR